MLTDCFARSTANNSVVKESLNQWFFVRNAKKRLKNTDFGTKHQSVPIRLGFLKNAFALCGALL